MPHFFTLSHSSRELAFSQRDVQGTHAVLNASSRLIPGQGYIIHQVSAYVLLRFIFQKQVKL